MAKSQIISISELFSKSWSVYKKIWSTLFIISAFTTIAWKLWQIYVVPFMLTLSGVSSITTGLVSQNPSVALGVGLAGLTVLLLSWIVVFEIGFLGSTAIIVALELQIEGKQLNFNKIFGRAKPLLLPISIVSILVFVVELIGFAFFIIPGIILIFLLTFCNYIVVAEKKTGFAVLVRSITLVKSHFWDILVRYLVIGAVSFLVNITLDKAVWFQFVSQTLILPFSVIYHFLLYKDVSKNSV